MDAHPARAAEDRLEEQILSNFTTPALARARERAAADLEAAIVALGLAFGRYQRTTHALARRVRVDLTQRLEVPIILHVSRAGLSWLLERKLQGEPDPLDELAAAHHRQFLRSQQ